MILYQNISNKPIGKPFLYVAADGSVFDIIKCGPFEKYRQISDNDTVNRNKKKQSRSRIKA